MTLIIICAIIIIALIFIGIVAFAYLSAIAGIRKEHQPTLVMSLEPELEEKEPPKRRRLFNKNKG